jgi:hypothetical protein
MFDQLNDEKSSITKRRNLPFWALLSIWLVMSTGFTAYNWFLVRQDEAIAPHEQIVVGSIYKTTHWKQDTAFYSFTYADRKYYGSEIVGPDKMCICDVPVYFDPAHPSTSTLVDYLRKSKQDHSMMIGCGYASEGLAVILALVLWIKRSKTKSTENVSQV